MILIYSFSEVLSRGFSVDIILLIAIMFSRPSFVDASSAFLYSIDVNAHGTSVIVISCTLSDEILILRVVSIFSSACIVWAPLRSRQPSTLDWCMFKYSPLRF